MGHTQNRTREEEDLLQVGGGERNGDTKWLKFVTHTHTHRKP